MKVVIRIGGSVVASPPNPGLLSRYAELIQILKAQGHEIVVIVGGGSSAREIIQVAKKLDLAEKEQDEVAISVSRLFAQLLAMKLGGWAWRNVPTLVEEVHEVLRKRGVVVMGGLMPGMTTDTVAALVASEIHADLIVKATDQDGIYTMDPRNHPEAKKIDELGFDELAGLLEKNRHEAGIHQIIDPKAMQMLKEKRVKMIIVNGFNPENIVAAVKGKKIGTKIY